MQVESTPDDGFVATIKTDGEGLTRADALLDTYLREQFEHGNFVIVEARMILDSLCSDATNRLWHVQVSRRAL